MRRLVVIGGLIVALCLFIFIGPQQTAADGQAGTPPTTSHHDYLEWKWERIWDQQHTPHESGMWLSPLPGTDEWRVDAWRLNAYSEPVSIAQGIYESEEWISVMAAKTSAAHPDDYSTIYVESGSFVSAGTVRNNEQSPHYVVAIVLETTIEVPAYNVVRTFRDFSILAVAGDLEEATSAAVELRDAIVDKDDCFSDCLGRYFASNCVSECVSGIIDALIGLPIACAANCLASHSLPQDLFTCLLGCVGSSATGVPIGCVMCINDGVQSCASHCGYDVPWVGVLSYATVEP